MFNSVVLEVAIGLVLVYLLLSLLCSSLNEWIAQVLGLRASTLKQAIQGMLGDRTDLFFQHPLIRVLTNRAGGPSYIPAANFAFAVQGIITKNAAVATINDLRDAIASLPDGDLKTSLTTLLQDSTLTLEQARQRLQQWFDEVMSRVSGWYARKIRWITFGIAFTVTLVLNVDTREVAIKLANSTSLRLTAVALAEQRVAAGSAENGRPQTQFSVAEHDLFGNIIGANDRYERFGEHLPGWIVTAIAVSFGAPFWFDLLNKVVNLRSSRLPVSPKR
jgi:hypothetical protein